MALRKPNRFVTDGDVTTVFIRSKGAEIPCLFDTDELAKVSLFTWVTNGKYVFHRSSSNGEVYFFYLHQFLLSREFVSDGNVVDHINQNPFDNRKVNLRVISKALNGHNRTSKLRGALRGSSYSKRIGLFLAQCKHGDKYVFLGWHRTAEVASAKTMTYLRQHNLIPS